MVKVLKLDIEEGYDFLYIGDIKLTGTYQPGIEVTIVLQWLLKSVTFRQNFDKMENFK